MTSAEHPWEKIYKKDGRIFPEPFPRFHEVVDLFVEHACSDILDLGCGSGRHTVHLALVNFKTFGLDISSSGLGLTQEWLREKGLESRIVLSDFRHPLPFRDESFSGVFSTQVIHHARIAAVRLAIREIWRVLSSGGVAFISVAAGKDDEEFVEIEPGEDFWAHSIFDSGPIPASLYAIGDTQIRLWSKEDILAVVQRNPEAIWAVTCRLIGIMRHAREIIYGMAFQPVSARLSQLILDRFHDEDDLLAERDLTLDQIASMISSTPQVVCRVMYQFQEEGLMELSRATIKLLDPKGLEKLTEAY